MFMILVFLLLWLFDIVIFTVKNIILIGLLITLIIILMIISLILSIYYWEEIMKSEDFK